MFHACIVGFVPLDTRVCTALQAIRLTLVGLADKCVDIADNSTA
jgi:hypothetical protein